MSEKNEVATTSNSIVAWESPEQIGERIRHMTKIFKEVMKDGVDYGKIQGCGDKPVLLKSGGEMILTAFRLVPDYIIEELGDGVEVVRYRVTAKLSLIGNDSPVSVGVGECSSEEEKYAWRGVVCIEEYDSFPSIKKRIKWKKGWNGSPAKSINQVKTDAPTIANTILKMAKKRALIDASMSLGASRIFTQDIEDLPSEYEGFNSIGGFGGDQPKKSTKPTVEEPVVNTINSNQCADLEALLSEKNISEDVACRHAGINQLCELGAHRFSAFIEYINSGKCV